MSLLTGKRREMRADPFLIQIKIQIKQADLFSLLIYLENISRGQRNKENHLVKKYIYFVVPPLTAWNSHTAFTILINIHNGLHVQMWKGDKGRNLNLPGKTKHHVLEQKRKTQRETYANS